jgi:dTDP-4-dehydrorhamnose 3,5-epimerase
MQFTETKLRGAWIIDTEPVGDSRGSFARTFCEQEFAAHGLETRFVQHSTSRSRKAGTLRGMHFQIEPYSEVKLVSCIRGALLDVIVDLRPDSEQFRQWQAVELTESNGRSLYIPRGFAHGFQTLRDNTEVHYLISEFYAPGSASGVRHNDPALGIEWPLPVSVISKKDRSWPDLKPLRAAQSASR